ncbi:MAG: hypothetical protein U0573_00380 [Phycisphaerales bacterium]|nr:hypothetical protein [Planctomycetota bacterium]
MDVLLNVKYRNVDQQGRPQGFLASKATLSDLGFESKLGKIECSRFVRAEVRANRVILLVKNDAGVIEPKVIEVYKPKPAAFARAFNRIASDTRTLAHQAELEAQGRGSELRVRRCAACDGMVDLTDFPESHEMYCPFCDTVSNAAVPSKEQEKIRVCDRCGFFSMPRTITCFYFYFLLVVYGFSYQRKHMCSPCMRSEAWKMLAGNFLFLLGVPVALTQLGRAYFGGTALSGAYQGLEGANVVARKLQPENAAAKYAEIATRLGGSAIASFNAGVAFASAKKMAEAQRAFETSLRVCSNFEPGGNGLIAVMTEQKLDPRTSPLLAVFFKQVDAQQLPDSSEPIKLSNI